MEGLFEYVLQKIQNTIHTDLQHSVITTSIVLYLVFPLLNVIIERKGKKGERKGKERGEKEIKRNRLLCQAFLEVRNKSRAGFYISNLISNLCGVFLTPCFWVPLARLFLSIQHY